MVIITDTLEFPEVVKNLLASKMPLNVRQVVYLLHFCFKAAEYDIQFMGKYLTLLELVKEHPDLKKVPANQVIVRFFGGPPNHQNFYNGSLYTLLAEEFMQALIHKRETIIQQFFMCLYKIIDV